MNILSTWKLSRNRGGHLQNMFECHLRLKTTMKNQFSDHEHDFSCGSISQDFLIHDSFLGSIFKSKLQEKVPMSQTGHVDVHPKNYFYKYVWINNQLLWGKLCICIVEVSFGKAPLCCAAPGKAFILEQ